MSLTKSYNAVRIPRVVSLFGHALGTDDGDGLLAMRRKAGRSLLEMLRANPHQWSVLQAAAKNKYIVLQANRRGGKTTALGRWLLARCIVRDHHVVRILTHRLATPTQTWLAREKDGALLLLDELGLMPYVRVTRATGCIKEIQFPQWGSAIYVHDIGTEQALQSRRGVTANDWWCDEAQHVVYLPTAVDELISPTLADDDGRVILSGTPGRDLDTAFFAYARGSNAAGWTRTECYSWQNPLYGKTFTERWHTIVNVILSPARANYRLSDDDLERLRALTENQLLEIARGSLGQGELRTWVETLDPRLRREYFGAWIVGGGDYVFDWHDAPTEFYWARQGQSPIDISKQMDLPIVPMDLRSRINYLPKVSRHGADMPCSWYGGIGLDLGWNPGRSAWAVLVWSPQHPGRFLVLWTESHLKKNDQWILDRTVSIVSILREAGIVVVGVRADLNGIRAGTLDSWSGEFLARFGPTVPIQNAYKADKEMQIRALNADILSGRMSIVAGDDLDIEGRHLRFRARKEGYLGPAVIDKDRRVVLLDGRSIQPGDHVADGLRYARPLCPYHTTIVEAKGLPPTLAQQLHQEWVDGERAEGFSQ